MAYINDIQRIDNLTIADIIRVSYQYVPNAYKLRPYAYRDNEGRTLGRGTVILETEEQCCAYMAAYGNMHYKKLSRALEDGEFPYRALYNGVEIYDWGCGQGIGTVAVIEKLRQYGLLSKLKKVTLEEPSYIARQRAVLHVTQALGDSKVEIEDIPYYLPSDSGDNSNSITEIDVEEPCAIHIFSNILDIEAVSLKGVSKLITSSGTHHITLCIGPANLNESRINAFCNYFIKDGLRIFTNFRDTNFGHHPDGKAYGCLIKSFTFSLANNNDILHKYSYFAPVQYYASYSDIGLNGNIRQSAFEILAPFDMTAHKNLCPVYALISNLISRGRPTLASQKVLDYVSSCNEREKIKSLNTIARIQKTFVEALISDRLDLEKESLDILVVEDETEVAKIAFDDFIELYHHLIAMTQDFDDMTLPVINIHSKKDAKATTIYDAIIDVSIDKVSNPEGVVFSKYKTNH